MKQQTYRRLFVLVSASVLVAMAWLSVGTGCNGTPAAPDRDEVKRLTPTVWAGSPGNDPPELTDDNWKDLFEDDSIRTDESGEAELRLIGCDGSVWVFDNTTLSVWECTKDAEEENEAWCIEEGAAGFNINCSARFEVVNTPSAQVNIKATAFTVTYLPDKQLTLVTVFRGAVEVTPVINIDTFKLGEPVLVEPGFFLYTMPGEVSPEIGGVPAREPRPLDELPIIVYDLGIRGWMDDITRWAGEQQLLPPTWPFGPEQVTLAFDGGQLADARVQEALVTAIDKEAVMGRAFPDQDVQLTARIGGNSVDAFSIPYDPDKARAQLDEAGYDPGQVVTVLFPQEDDQVALMAKLIAGDLSRIDVPVELAPVPGAEIPAVMKEFAAAGRPFVAVYR